MIALSILKSSPKYPEENGYVPSQRSEKFLFLCCSGFILGRVVFTKPPEEVWLDGGIDSFCVHGSESRSG